MVLRYGHLTASKGVSIYIHASNPLINAFAEPFKHQVKAHLHVARGQRLFDLCNRRTWLS